MGEDAVAVGNDFASEKANSSRAGYFLLQALTFSRVPLALVVSTLLLWLGRGRELSFTVLFVSFGILVVSEITDLLDGFIARRYGLVSEWGAMLDPYSDSVSRLIIYASLAHAGLLYISVPIVMAVRDLTVSYCRILMAQRKLSVRAKLSGKIKAVVQSISGMIVLMGPIYWSYTGTWTIGAFSWLVMSVTVLSAIQYVVAAYRATRMPATA